MERGERAGSIHQSADMYPFEKVSGFPDGQQPSIICLDEKTASETIRKGNLGVAA